MAIKQGSESFTKWTHVENGQVLVRRIHRIDVQAADGHLHHITGNRLPEFIYTCTGQGHKGSHLAQILLSPQSSRKSPYEPPVVRIWPTWRDVVHVVIGFSAVGLLNFIASLASASY